MLKRYMISLVALSIVSGLLHAVVSPVVEEDRAVTIIKELLDLLKKNAFKPSAVEVIAGIPGQQEKEKYKAYIQETIQIYQYLLRDLEQASSLAQFTEWLEEQLHFRSLVPESAHFVTPPPLLEQ